MAVHNTGLSLAFTTERLCEIVPGLSETSLKRWHKNGFIPCRLEDLGPGWSLYWTVRDALVAYVVANLRTGYDRLRELRLEVNEVMPIEVDNLSAGTLMFTPKANSLVLRQPDGDRELLNDRLTLFQTLSAVDLMAWRDSVVGYSFPVNFDLMRANPAMRRGDQQRWAG